MSTMYIYVCRHCGVGIDRHAKTRLVTDEAGLHFYHVEPDCYELHKAKLEREAYNNAIAIQREFDYMPDDQWYKKNAPDYTERHSNGG